MPAMTLPLPWQFRQTSPPACRPLPPQAGQTFSPVPGVPAGASSPGAVGKGGVAEDVMAGSDSEGWPLHGKPDARAGNLAFLGRETGKAFALRKERRSAGAKASAIATPSAALKFAWRLALRAAIPWNEAFSVPDRHAQVNPFRDKVRLCLEFAALHRRFPHGDCPQESGIQPRASPDR